MDVPSSEVVFVSKSVSRIVQQCLHLLQELSWGSSMVIRLVSEKQRLHLLILQSEELRLYVLCPAHVSMLLSVKVRRVHANKQSKSKAPLNCRILMLQLV